MTDAALTAVNKVMQEQGNEWRADWMENGETPESIVAMILTLKNKKPEGPADWGMNAGVAGSFGFGMVTGRDSAASYVSSYISGPTNNNALYAIVDAAFYAATP